MTAARITDPAAFVVANTTVLSPPLLPEIKLHLAEESLAIWAKTEAELGASGLPPPYWAFAWAGGQALGRYLLDTPGVIAGKRVLDLAAGCGVGGIAAMRAGAAAAVCNDIDDFAGAAMALNAALNAVALTIQLKDLLSGEPATADIVLVGDVFYEKPLAARALAWLIASQMAGALILAGDPQRSYFPKSEFEYISEYLVPVSRELEDTEIKRTSVWRLKPR